jgi:RimJ/RimL family protein N-acetyltransferase
MLDANDFDAYALMHADEEVVRYLGNGKPLTRAESWRHFAMMIGHWTLRGYGNWAVEEKATGAFVGRVGFYNPEEWPGFELGWTLAREHWGRGFATEAARASVAFGFERLGLRSVVAVVEVGNERSMRVAEKLGMRATGHRAHPVTRRRLRVMRLGRPEDEARDALA